MSDLSEGFFGSDRQTTKIVSDTEEGANEKLKAFLAKNKNYNPKATSKAPKRDRNGNFFYEVTFQSRSEEDDPSLAGRLKRGYKAVKKAVDEIPKSYLLKAPSEQQLKRKLSDFKKKNDVARVGKIRKDDSGTFVLQVFVNKPKTQEEQPEQPEQTQQKAKLSNIQKQLAKLSDDHLAKIEDYINKVNKINKK